MAKVILFLAWAIFKPVDVDFCTVHKSVKVFPIKVRQQVLISHYKDNWQRPK